MFCSFNADAQSGAEIQKAFKDSYANEYKFNYKGAIADLQKFQAESYETNVRLGWLTYMDMQYVVSMKHYQTAIDLKKFSVEARLGYAMAAKGAKEFTKSYDKYEEILKIDPYNSFANYGVGLAYYAAKKYDVAAKYFELLVNMYPFDYDANHMLGWTYLTLGKKAQSKILFEKALLYKPGDPSSMDGFKKSIN